MKEISDVRLRNVAYDAIKEGDGPWRAWTVLLDSSACYEFEFIMQLVINEL